MSAYSSEWPKKSNMESQDLNTIKSFKAPVYCNKGHIMTLEREHVYEEPEKCDDCGEILDLPFYDCEECNQDICISCSMQRHNKQKVLVSQSLKTQVQKELDIRTPTLKKLDTIRE